MGKASLRTQREAVDDVTTALERQNAAIERNNAAQEKAIELENKRLKQDSSHFAANEKGERIVAGSDLGTATGIFKFLQEAGVTDSEKAKAITREFLDTQGNVTYSNNPGQIKYGGDTISVALLKAAELFTFGAGGAGGANGFGGASPGPAPAAPTGNAGQPASPPPTRDKPTPAPGGNTNVTIHLAAGVNVSSRSEVEKLARAIMPAIDGLQRRGISGG